MIRISLKNGSAISNLRFLGQRALATSARLSLKQKTTHNTLKFKPGLQFQHHGGNAPQVPAGTIVTVPDVFSSITPGGVVRFVMVLVEVIWLVTFACVP